MYPFIGIVVLLGSLATSTFTNRAEWFLVGYPVALLIVMVGRRRDLARRSS